jgi:acetyl-CoA carboxylase carboxyl transferase subunit alpha
LWNDPSKVEQATKALKITPDALKEHNLIDDIIDEPISGAHRDKEAAAKAIKNYYLNSVKELRELTKDELLERRYKKLTSIGAFKETSS